MINPAEYNAVFNPVLAWMIKHNGKSPRIKAAAKAITIKIIKK